MSFYLTAEDTEDTLVMLANMPLNFGPDDEDDDDEEDIDFDDDELDQDLEDVEIDFEGSSGWFKKKSVARIARSSKCRRITRCSAASTSWTATRRFPGSARSCRGGPGKRAA